MIASSYKYLCANTVLQELNLSQNYIEPMATVTHANIFEINHN